MNFISDAPIYQLFLNELDNLQLVPDNARELFHDVIKKYDGIHQNTASKYLTLEHEMFHIRKSASGGFTPKSIGTVKNEDGIEEETIWPNFNKYDHDTFQYFKRRFETSKNKLLKPQYGLMCYISGHLKDNRDKIALVNSLVSYANYTFTLPTDTNSNHHNLHYYSEYLRNAIEISIHAKLDETADKILNELQMSFLTLSINDSGYYTVIYLLDEVVLLRKSAINISPILSKIMSDGDALNNQLDLHTAIRILKIGIHIATKYSEPNLSIWQDKIGLILERAGDKEIARKNFFGSSFYEQAAEFFKDSKNTFASQRVLNKFQDARGHIELELFTSELSEEEKTDVEEHIQQLLSKKNPILIFHVLTLRPNISSIIKIRKQTDPEPKDPFWDIGLDAIDKFGNTVERYKTPEEQKEQRFWETFGFELGFASKISYKLMIGALEKGIVNAEILISYFETTWFNVPITRYYQNVEHLIVPLNLLIPGIREFFRVFENYINGELRVTAADFVLSIDSLVLKVEMLLRLICERKGIPTIIQKQSKNKYMVPRFKTLSNLFDNLKNLNFWDAKDEAILRFLFIEPEHSNMRNEIAHGLTDLNEYSPELGLRVIGGLVLISSYKVELTSI